MITRRFFTKLAFAAALQSRIKGVMVGAQSYSFRGMPFDEMLAAMSTVRTDHSATLLLSGQVLVTGGFGVSGSPSRTAELYDATTDQWTLVAMMRVPRANHTTTLLPSGEVLAVGGWGNWVTAEIYDPAGGTWSPAAELNEGRALHSATRLNNGTILVASGVDPDNTYLTSSELLDITRTRSRELNGHEFSRQ